MTSVPTKKLNSRSNELQYSSGLKKIKRFRRYMLLSFLICNVGGLTIFAIAAGSHMPQDLAYIVYILLFLVFAFIWVFLVYSKCPRCHNLFFGGYWAPPGRVLDVQIVCRHCELSEESLNSQLKETFT